MVQPVGRGVAVPELALAAERSGVFWRSLNGVSGEHYEIESRPGRNWYGDLSYGGRRRRFPRANKPSPKRGMGLGRKPKCFRLKRRLTALAAA